MNDLQNSISKGPRNPELEVPIRIAIADDHPIFRDALRQSLSLQKDFEVVAEMGDGNDVLSAVEEHQPNILLLGLKLPGTDGLAVLQKMQAANHAATKVIVLTASEDTNEFLQAIEFGTSGIVLKKSPIKLLFQRIREVHASEIPLNSPSATRQFLAGKDHPRNSQNGHDRSPLSRREREIVAYVARGFRNKELAEKMLLSEQTVKNHMHNIFEKLGVSDRLDLALCAIHKKLCA